MPSRRPGVHIDDLMLYEYVNPSQKNPARNIVPAANPPWLAATLSRIGETGSAWSLGLIASLALGGLLLIATLPSDEPGPR